MVSDSGSWIVRGLADKDTRKCIVGSEREEPSSFDDRLRHGPAQQPPCWERADSRKPRPFHASKALCLTRHSFSFGSGDPDCPSEESGRTEETD